MPSRLRIDRWIALVCLGLTAAGAGAATFTVTTTADSGAGSLRQAIVDANGNPGDDTIAFAIPGNGVHTISVGSPLTITDTVAIQGYTQPGSSLNTDPHADNAVLAIELQGNGTDGIVVTGGAARIGGLVLHGFQNAINLGILKRFEENEIGFAYPTRTVIVQGAGSDAGAALAPAGDRRQ